MRYIVVSSCCSRKKYEEIFNSRTVRFIDPAQKFLNQLIRGMVSKEDEIIACSSLPVSFSTSKQRRFSRFEEYEDGVHYIYPGFKNGIISRFLTTYQSFKKELRRLINDKVDTVVICDALSLEISKAAISVCRSSNVCCIAILTDIPIMATKMKNNVQLFKRMALNLYEKMSGRLIKRFDAYIELSKYMDELINPGNMKPSIVIEGSVDTSLLDSSKRSVGNSTDKKIVLYAGGVYEKYGIGNLISAFSTLDDYNVELHIYGSGSFVHSVVESSKKDCRIKYMGVALNTKLLFIESNATILVNPRFTNEEYTKYSFPSKILEYMLSGRPVLTTRLKGIPSEYKDFLFWIDEETPIGVSTALQTILGKTDEELAGFGMRSRAFVVEKKNMFVQGKRIKDFSLLVIKKW